MQFFLSPPSDVKCTEYRDWLGRPQPMKKVCPKCINWVHIIGVDPNKGTPVDGYQCARVGAILMQIETTQMIRQMDAGITKKLTEVGNKIAHHINYATQVQIALSEGAALPAPAQRLIAKEAPSQ